MSNYHLEFWVFLLLAYFQKDDFLAYMQRLWDKEYKHTLTDGAIMALNILGVFVVSDIVMNYVLAETFTFEWLYRLPVILSIFCNILVLISFFVSALRKKFDYAAGLIATYAVLGYLYIKFMGAFAYYQDSIMKLFGAE